jgi:hypothetical protein
MALNNYGPDSWEPENEFEDETLMLLDQHDVLEFENETAHLNSDDALEVGDFVWEAFDAASNPGYSDS